MEKPPE